MKREFQGTWEREGRRPNVKQVVRISGRRGAPAEKQIDVQVEAKDGEIQMVQCVVRRNGRIADPVGTSV